MNKLEIIELFETDELLLKELLSRNKRYRKYYIISLIN